MTTTENPKPTKSPRKRKAAPAADAPSAPATSGADDGGTMDRIHRAGQHGLSSADEPQAQSLTRADPDEATAEAAAAEESGSALASAIQRALRFSDKERDLVRLTSGSVTGTSARGTIIVPWSAPMLPDDGIVVDGRRLHRCLRAAGPAAVLKVDTQRLIVSFGTRRFTLALVPEKIDAHVPTRDGVDFQPFNPAVFRTAAAFTGDDKITPPELSGVNVSLGGCIACDRRGLIASFGATSATGIKLTLPRDTFDGLSVAEDGSEVVYLGVSPEGHAVIVDPRTGEWRVVVGWSSTFPDVRGVLARWDASVFADVDKAAFVSALKQFRIVQSAGSSVKFNVWTSPPGSEGAGDWMEMRGGDPGVACEFVARLGVKIHRMSPVGVSADLGMVKVCVALDELLKLAAAHPGAEVRLGFGKDERSPVVVKNAVFEAGIMPMVDR